MRKSASAEKIKGYCGMCSSWCPTVSHVKNGVFIRVSSDKQHPLTNDLCPKGFAGPELVYNEQRLRYPMRRTQPKGSTDPGWERITWDEALDLIATRLNSIKQQFGPESVAFTRAGPGGSPLGELSPWAVRLAHAFGSPNNIGTTNICQWHRDNCSSYTYGRIVRSAGRAEFEQSACILIWGNNTHATRTSLIPLIKRGQAHGAKLIVVDPRKIEIANMSDLWLQIRPGTDGAMALSMINVILKENLYDHNFVRDWTTAPFLVDTTSGRLIKANEVIHNGDPDSFVIFDPANREPKESPAGKIPFEKPALIGSFTLKTPNGELVKCKTVFSLLSESVSKFDIGAAETITGIPKDKIQEAARMFATVKPSCWYSWNGIEQTTNASQTNRAMCILYALTGNYDKPGGNIIPPRLPMKPINGEEFLSPEQDAKRLGYKERPLGPSSRQMAMTTQGYEVYQAILTGKPYPVKGLLGFGGNLITSNVPGLLGKKAIMQLDFHVQAELFMTPTAELADVVLPAASCWESWHVGINLDSLSEKAIIQLRPAVVSPQNEAWPDIKIIFELAKRLGLEDRFWHGNIEASFDYQLSPLNITVEKLKANPGGISINLSKEYRKYSKTDAQGIFEGFPTPSKRIEIYSDMWMKHGYSPLPAWSDPSVFTKTDTKGKYPFILISSKVIEYCHSQLRAVASLRKRVPHPFLEINEKRASEAGIAEGDWVLVETPYGSITVQAKPTDTINYDVVCTQNGWWQGCTELNLPGYDPFSSNGANVTLLYSSDNIDPLSGSVLIKGQPCNVRKLPRT